MQDSFAFDAFVLDAGNRLLTRDGAPVALARATSMHSHCSSRRRAGL